MVERPDSKGGKTVKGKGDGLNALSIMIGHKPLGVREWYVVVWMRMTPIDSHLNAWSPVSGTVCEAWEGIPLQEEVLSVGVGLEVSEAFTIPS